MVLNYQSYCVTAQSTIQARRAARWLVAVTNAS